MSPQLKAALREKISQFKTYGLTDENGEDVETTLGELFEPDELIEALQPEIERLVVSTKLKQTRRILQHEKDVWGAVKSESYFQAEINMLKSQLTQLTRKEKNDRPN